MARRRYFSRTSHSRRISLAETPYTACRALVGALTLERRAQPYRAITSDHFSTWILPQFHLRLLYALFPSGQLALRLSRPITSFCNPLLHKEILPRVPSRSLH